MKKHFIPIAIMAVALLALPCCFSCTGQEEQPDPEDPKQEQKPEVRKNPEPGVYTFVMAPDYKNSTSEAGRTSWKEGDKIYVHGNYEPTSVVITLTSSEISVDGKTATVNMETVPTTGALPDTLYAAYPADDVARDLTFCESYNTFGATGSMLLTAYMGKERNFVFEHLTGAIAFSVSGEYDGFVIQGARNEELWFDSYGVIVTSQTQDYRKSVGDGHRFFVGTLSSSGAGVAYIGPRMELTEGFSIYLKVGETYPKVFRYTSSAKIIRGEMIDLGDITASLEDYSGEDPVDPVMPAMGSHKRIPVNVQELSGICLTMKKDSLWVVGDEGQLARVSFDGEVTNIHHFSNDLEGVTLHPETGDLYFAAEGSQKVYRCVYPFTKYEVAFPVQEAIDGKYGNSGIEGITYYKDDMLYVGSQVGANLWKYTVDGEKISMVSLKTVTTAIQEIAGLCYDPVNDWLWVADSEAAKIFVFSGDASVLLAKYSVSWIGNAESVCVDHTHGCIWVGDDDDSSPAINRVEFTGLIPTEE